MDAKKSEVRRALEFAGFSAWEAAVIAALMRASKAGSPWASARRLSLLSGIPRGKVYPVAKRLAREGLVQVARDVAKHPRLLFALVPSRLAEELEKATSAAEERARALRMACAILRELKPPKPSRFKSTSLAAGIIDAVLVVESDEERVFIDDLEGLRRFLEARGYKVRLVRR